MRYLSYLALVSLLFVFGTNLVAATNPKTHQIKITKLKNNLKSLKITALGEYKINQDAPVKLELNSKLFSKRDFKYSKDKKSISLKFNPNKAKSANLSFYICSKELCKKVKEKIRI